MTADYEQARAELAARNTCGRCGQRASGFGWLDGVRYCDGERRVRRTCLELAQAEKSPTVSITRPDLRSVSVDGAAAAAAAHSDELSAWQRRVETEWDGRDIA